MYWGDHSIYIYIYIYTVHFKHDSIMLSSVANFGAVLRDGDVHLDIRRLCTGEDCNGFLHGHLGDGFSSQMFPVGSPLGQWGSTLGIPWAGQKPWIYGHFTKKIMDILDVVRSETS